MTEPAVQGATPEIDRDADWQRLDPRMLLLHPVRELVRYFPVLIGLVVAGSATEGGPSWQYLGVAVPIALGLLRYLTTSFRIAEGRVELRRGLVSRHVLSTPLDRVRSVDLTASPIHRLLGLTTIRIGTGSSSGYHDDALDLDGLPGDRARELRRELLHLAVSPADPAVVAGAADGPHDVVVAFDVSWVRYAPLTSNGLIIAAAVLGGGTQLLNTFGLWRHVDPEGWALPLPLGVAVALGVVLAGLVVVVLSVVGYLVTNGGFRLTRGGGSWHVRRGLLTTRETSLDETRVAGVSVAEPLALRLVGARQLAAVVTGLDRKARGSSMLVPPVPREVVVRTAVRVVGAEAPVVGPLVAHGAAAVRRRWTRALVPAAVVAVGFVALAVVVGRVWPLAPAVVVVAAAVGLAADRAAALGHGLHDGYLVARSGSLRRHRELLATEHVIGWTFRATWFQRRAGLTTLVATTAGGSQQVRVLDLPEPDAVALAATAVPGLVEQFLALSARGGRPGPARP